MYPPEPLRQIMQCPPGQVPPPQSLASLYTPGQGKTWHAGYVPRGMPIQPPPGGGYYPPQMQQQFYQQQQQQQYQQQQHGNRMQAGHGRGANQGGRAGGQGQRGGRGGREQIPQQHRTHHHKPSDATSRQSAQSAPSVDKTGDIAPGLSAPTQRPQQHTQQGPGPQNGQHPPQGGFQPPPQSQQTTPRRPFASNLPCGEMMTHSDVRFVVSKVLQLTETQDPYNDDFYFIQVR